MLCARTDILVSLIITFVIRSVSETNVMQSLSESALREIVRRLDHKIVSRSNTQFMLVSLEGKKVSLSSSRNIIFYMT
jgi:hypothetical protein